MSNLLSSGSQISSSSSSSYKSLFPFISWSSSTLHLEVLLALDEEEEKKEEETIIITNTCSRRNVTWKGRRKSAAAQKVQLNTSHTTTFMTRMTGSTTNDDDDDDKNVIPPYKGGSYEILYGAVLVQDPYYHHHGSGSRHGHVLSSGTTSSGSRITPHHQSGGALLQVIHVENVHDIVTALQLLLHTTCHYTTNGNFYYRSLPITTTNGSPCTTTTTHHRLSSTGTDDTTILYAVHPFHSHPLRTHDSHSHRLGNNQRALYKWLFIDREEGSDTSCLVEPDNVITWRMYRNIESETKSSSNPPNDDSYRYLFCIAIPSTLNPGSLVEWFGGHAAGLAGVRVLRNAAEVRAGGGHWYYSAILLFRNREHAEAFYRDYQGVPFPTSCFSSSCSTTPPTACLYIVVLQSLTTICCTLRTGCSSTNRSVDNTFLCDNLYGSASMDVSTPRCGRYSFPYDLTYFVPPPLPQLLQSCHSSLDEAFWWTGALRQLPTCPVCLERLDESITGLGTGGEGSGGWGGYPTATAPLKNCGVCTLVATMKPPPTTRNVAPAFTCDGSSSTASSAFSTELLISSSSLTCASSPPSSSSLSCSTSSSPSPPPACEFCVNWPSLWLCYVCGHIGCGRYANQHALRHAHTNPTHTLSLQLATGRIWDYSRDQFVHKRLVQKSSVYVGRLVELPLHFVDGGTTSIVGDTRGHRGESIATSGRMRSKNDSNQTSSPCRRLSGDRIRHNRFDADGVTSTPRPFRTKRADKRHADDKKLPVVRAHRETTSSTLFESSTVVPSSTQLETSSLHASTELSIVSSTTGSTTSNGFPSLDSFLSSTMSPPSSALRTPNSAVPLPFPPLWFSNYYHYYNFLHFHRYRHLRNDPVHYYLASGARHVTWPARSSVHEERKEEKWKIQKSEIDDEKRGEKDNILIQEYKKEDESRQPKEDVEETYPGKIEKKEQKYTEEPKNKLSSVFYYSSYSPSSTFGSSSSFLSHSLPIPLLSSPPTGEELLQLSDPASRFWVQLGEVLECQLEYQRVFFEAELAELNTAEAANIDLMHKRSETIKMNINKRNTYLNKLSQKYTQLRSKIDTVQSKILGQKSAISLVKEMNRTVLAGMSSEEKQGRRKDDQNEKKEDILVENKNNQTKKLQRLNRTIVDLETQLSDLMAKLSEPGGGVERESERPSQENNV